MRDRSTEHIRDGLTAIAMIERDRSDFREALLALAFLNYAARSIGADADDLLRGATSFAGPSMAELIRGFLKRSEDERHLHSWGHTVVQTEAGPGLAGWGSRPYRSTLPLDQAGLAIARLLKQDKYDHKRVTLASELPAVWLSRVDGEAPQHKRSSIRAAVTIHADLRPQEGPGFQNQVMTTFLVEADDEATAAALFKSARDKQAQSNDLAIVAVQECRLFCLVVLRTLNVTAEVHRPSKPLV